MSADDREPPPMGMEEEEGSFLGEDKSGEDLFKSAVEVVAPARDEDSSGYNTVEDATAVVRSDTLDDVNKESDINLDDDDDLFKSARIEPEPEKFNGASSPASDSTRGDSTRAVLGDTPDEVPLDDEDENPFEDAHLKLSSDAPPTNGSEQPAFLSAPVPAARQQQQQRTSSILDGMDDSEEQKELSDEFIEISVADPHKVGEGMSAFMAYKVRSKTNINYFKRKDMEVTRRFSDFLGLHDKLSEKYLPNGRIIPPAPDKSVVNMTKLKMSRGAGAAANDEFTEKRRAALERFLNRTAMHPTLRTDPDFREFLELDAELPRANQTSALSGKNVMKMISKVGDRVANMNIKMGETDDWFGEKCNTIEQLDAQLRKLHLSTEALADFRRNLAFSTGSLAKSLAVLSTCEENSALSAAIAQLSTVEERLEHVHAQQASADFYKLSELIKDHIGLVGAVKEVFHERIKAWQAWQNVTANLTKKREAKVKAELQQKQDRVVGLRQEIAELERQQEMAQENFEKISRLIKKEVQTFDVQKVKDFKKNIIEYLEVMLKAQDEIAGHWERYIPEIKQVNV